MKPCFLLVFASLLFSVIASAMPAQVLIIRHGEKPNTGNTLSAVGYQRAQKLVNFFETNSQVNAFGKIAGIFAMPPPHGDGSVRAIETVTPTAQALGLTVNSDFSRDQPDKLFKAVRDNPAFNGRTVLICWEHKVIPDVAAAFGLVNGPQNWDGDSIFDRMWILTYASDGSVNLTDVPEHVLPGDSTN